MMIEMDFERRARLSRVQLALRLLSMGCLVAVLYLVFVLLGVAFFAWWGL